MLHAANRTVQSPVGLSKRALGRYSEQEFAELTLGQWMLITVGANMPTNRVSRKPSSFSYSEI
jgi:hypothetical protein